MPTPKLDLLRLTEGQPADATNLIDEIRQELAALSDDQEIHERALRAFVGENGCESRMGKYFVACQPMPRESSWPVPPKRFCKEASEASERHLLEVRQSPTSKANSDPGQLGVLGLVRFGGRSYYHGPLEIMFLCEPPRGEGTRPGYTTEHFNSPRCTSRRATVKSRQRCARLSLRFRRTSFPAKAPANSSLSRTRPFTITTFWAEPGSVANSLRRGAWREGAAVCEKLLCIAWSRGSSPPPHRADETGIKALQRRLLRRVTKDADEPLSFELIARSAVLIEDVVQFLQLLSGGEARGNP